MFHNEVHSYKDKIDPCEIKKKSEPATSKLTTIKPATSKPIATTPITLKKEKDIRRKYRIQAWKRRKREANVVAANQVLNSLYLAKLVPNPTDCDEHEHVITINYIKAIVLLRRTWKEEEDIDMSESAKPTEVIKLIINTLGSDAISPEE